MWIIIMQLDVYNEKVKGYVRSYNLFGDIPRITTSIYIYNNEYKNGFRELKKN